MGKEETGEETGRKRKAEGEELEEERMGRETWAIASSGSMEIGAVGRGRLGRCEEWAWDDVRGRKFG